MANQQLNLASPAVRGTICDHWKLYLIEGMILVVLGLLAAFMPPWVGTFLFAWLFLISGVAGLVTTVMLRHGPGFWWSLLSALFTLGVGAMLFVQPVLGWVTLTFLLIAFLI